LQMAYSVTHAAEYKVKFADYNYTIGCINLDTYTLHTPKDSSLLGCNLGKNYMRIMTPTKNQWKLLMEVFGNKDRVVNVLPILNSESQFNHNTIGYNKFGKDCGVLQIRDVNGGCKMTERQQYEWLKKRIDSQKSET